MYEYAAGRFVKPSAMITANIYEKAEKDSTGQGSGRTILRVAIDIDVKNAERNVIYSDPMADRAAAIRYIEALPVSQKD